MVKRKAPASAGDEPSGTGGPKESRRAREDERNCVATLARGLEVMRAFTRSQPRMSLSEIANATGLARASVRRVVLTLMHEGYADMEGKYFGLRPKVLQLGYTALSSLSFLDVTQPILTRLAIQLRESCLLAVLDGHDVVYVASAAPPDRIVSIAARLGGRSSAHCVSSGRVLVAALPEEERFEYLKKAKITRRTPNTVTSRVRLRSLIEETRIRGWSIVDQEFEIGLRSISVPVCDRAGRVVAALNVACPESRVTPQDMSSWMLLELQAASLAITAGLR